MLLTASGVLALDDRQRDAVDEDRQGHDDVGPGPADAELGDEDEVVVIGVVEVQEAGGLPAGAAAQVLHQGQVVDQGGVEDLVGLKEAVDLLAEVAGGPAQVGVVDPRVQAAQRGAQAQRRRAWVGLSRAACGSSGARRR